MGQSKSKRESGASVQQRTNSGTPTYSRTYDRLLKLLLIGDSDTGKSSLLLRFGDNTFIPNLIPTIGVDFKIKTVSLDGLRVKLQIWDTAGIERFRINMRAYYRGATGMVVVYSATDETTFDRVSYWLDEIEKNASPGVPVILVGTKCDLVEEKEVEYERARDFADEKGLPLFETSAKDGTNVELAFLTFTAYILESCQISISDTGKISVK